MDEFDATKVARVWERVQMRPPIARNDSLYASLRMLATRYRALSAKLPQARALANDATSCANAIRGLQALSAPPRTEPCTPIARESVQSMLKKCAHAEQALHAELTRATADPTWQALYTTLSTRTATRLTTTLSLLGEST